DAALGLKANDGLGAKHLKMLEELDERGLDMLAAMIEAYKASGAKAAQEEDPEANQDPPPNPDEEDPNAMRKQNRAGKVLTEAEIDKLVANRVEEHLRRREVVRSEEHTSELQSRENLVCRLLLDKH